MAIEAAVRASLRDAIFLCDHQIAAAPIRDTCERQGLRIDVSESAPHGFEPGGEKGGCARQIGRTKGGMNTKLHAGTDARGRPIGRTKGGMNTKLHAGTDARGRPIRFFMSAGQISDYTGAAAPLAGPPKSDWLLADLGYEADWFRNALKDKGIKVCIPGRKSRKKPVKYDKRRNRIDIMFGRLKDWRRAASHHLNLILAADKARNVCPPAECLA